MTPVMAAVLVLFSGQDLEGWITLKGEWDVEQGALVCQAAPASIRSSYESEEFVLEFEYRRAGRGESQLFIHSGLDGGGIPVWLTPAGAFADERPRQPGGPSDEWIQVRVEAEPEGIRVQSAAPGEASAAEDRPLPDPVQSDDAGARSAAAERGAFYGVPSGGVLGGGRGFLRLESSEPGLQIRNIRVTEPDFVSMFSGDSLEGWEIMGQKDDLPPAWSIENGIISCRGQRGWLRTLRAYDNFVLRLEYWIPPRANSGVYVRAPMEGRVSQIGMEIQLLDDEGWRPRQLKPSQLNGAVYGGIAPEVQVPAPAEQWNSIEILLDGRRVRTVLNAVQLYDAQLDDEEADAQLLRNPLATRRTVGFIGLQDHTGQPRFRNVRIRELKLGASTQPRSAAAGR